MVDTRNSVPHYFMFFDYVLRNLEVGLIKQQNFKISPLLVRSSPREL